MCRRHTYLAVLFAALAAVASLGMAACGSEDEPDCVLDGERCASTSQCCGELVCLEAELPGIYRCQ